MKNNIEEKITSYKEKAGWSEIFCIVIIVYRVKEKFRKLIKKLEREIGLGVGTD